MINDGVKVGWDDDIPNWMEKIKFMFPKPPISICSGTVDGCEILQLVNDLSHVV